VRRHLARKSRDGKRTSLFARARAGGDVVSFDLYRLNQTMLSWESERIIFAHGPWHDANGTTELRNAFRWLLK
jgi:hypothetical protein